MTCTPLLNPLILNAVISNALFVSENRKLFDMRLPKGLSFSLRYHLIFLQYAFRLILPYTSFLEELLVLNFSILTSCSYLQSLLFSIIFLLNCVLTCFPILQYNLINQLVLQILESILKVHKGHQFRYSNQIFSLTIFIVCSFGF